MRFLMLAPMAGQADGDAYRRYEAGTIITNGSGAQRGDILWASLCACPASAPLGALDAEAVALLPPLYDVELGRPA